MKQFLRAALTAAALVIGSVPASAAPASFTGALGGDNDVQFFSFTLAADANVTLRTWSFDGGVNAAGNNIAAGGFDPILSLFFGSGAGAILIGASDDGIGLIGDSLLEYMPLTAGTYTLALTQFENFANGPTLGDGFLGTTTIGFGGRSSQWAVDIIGADTAVPEPATLVLALLALAAMGGQLPGRRPRVAVRAVV